MSTPSLPLRREQVRRYDIDWLRNAAILLLFPFHASRLFDHWDPFYAKNEELSWALSYFIAFASIWFMPLLFWLAGSSSWYALGGRTGAAYAKERVMRLLIPLLTGVLLIVPPQGYYALLTLGESPGSYFRYLGSFFTDFSDLSGYTGGFTPAHLWFILYLFVFSLLLLPLFRRWRSDKAAPGLEKLSVIMSRPIPYVLLALPLSATKLLPDPGGQNPFYFMALFAIGFLAVSNPRYQAMFDRYWKPFSLLGVLLSGFWVAALANSWLNGAAMELLRNAALLLVLGALLGFGHVRLNRKKGLLAYMNEAAFPVYVIHQTVIIIIGYYAVGWGLPLYGAFALILVLSFALCIAIYEFVLRRTAVTRLLFGIKARSLRK
ncbi:acyltransferase family protein [Paenibacillus soyae]|uniref:Acyltransferase family protein n=1 Tax=Paenibacillus soyae TaxID=2969249 RepID=A0A9X2SBU5_9BACL|nr:acyltransferase family protein [Paenibacillus soyae]MCR2808024.1 acyltransferase family protein [Paenibacillus soyae]